MKQKIVIKVQLRCGKCRSKALQIASVAKGVVNSVGVEGEDKVVVIGDGVDSACLAKALRKKFHYADILSVEEVKENTKPPPPPPIDERKNTEPPIPLLSLMPIPVLPYPPPLCACCCDTTATCIIM